MHEDACVCDTVYWLMHSGSTGMLVSIFILTCVIFQVCPQIPHGQKFNNWLSASGWSPSRVRGVRRTGTGVLNNYFRFCVKGFSERSQMLRKCGSPFVWQASANNLRTTPRRTSTYTFGVWCNMLRNNARTAFWDCVVDAFWTRFECVSKTF